MTKKEVKIKRRKGDKTATYYASIDEGFNQEAVFIYYFNPDQMARTMAETFASLFFTDSEPDDLKQAPWPGLKATKAAALKQPEHKGILKTRNKLPKDLTEEQLLSLYELYDHNIFCQAASAHIERNLWQEVEKFYEDFIETTMTQAYQALIGTAKQRGLKKPSLKDRKAVLRRWQQMKRIRFGTLDPHRPLGREDFDNREDFMTALKEALSNKDNKSKPPTRRELWHQMRQHELYRGKKKDMPTRNEAQTLDSWLRDCGIETYEEAIRRYWQPPRGGE